MPKEKEHRMLEDSENTEPMEQAEVESIAEATAETLPSCVFCVDRDGHPTVICPDAESQQEAVQALEENPEVVVRVRVKVEESAEGVNP